MTQSGPWEIGTGPGPRIPVCDTVLAETAQRYVAEVIASGWISSAGPAVLRFEKAFAEHLGIKHAVTASSGTTALHLTVATLGLGPGDEVIVPNFTMIAPINALLYVGATPVFVDCEEDIFTIDPVLIEPAITSRTKAILPVHTYGHSADMDPILAVARAHNLLVVEDAAEAHGARYKDRRCGSMGHVNAFSFYANKLITTGEGGMLVTNDDHWAARARNLRDMAHCPTQRFFHTELGFSYRMTSLQAAIGLGQLEMIEHFVAQKRRMADHYRRRLGGIRGLKLPTTRPWADNVHWMYAVMLDESAAQSRNVVCERLRAQGIETRMFFTPCNRQPMFSETIRSRHYPRTKKVSEQGFYLPSGLGLTESQIEEVCDALAVILS